MLLVDHAERIAEKIRISGGGRCNFTNLETSPAQFVSRNPDFCRSALARYTPRDFIDLIERHGIAWHEKHRGQLFCDGSSQQIIDMLLAECAASGVTHWQPCAVERIDARRRRFLAGHVTRRRRDEASDRRQRRAVDPADRRQRLRLSRRTPVRPPHRRDHDRRWYPCCCPSRTPALAGVSLPVRIATTHGKSQVEFEEDLLFTHRGLSGPAVLQISSYWAPRGEIRIDLSPAIDLRAALLEAKRSSTRQVGAGLAELLPRRLAETWLEPMPELSGRRFADCRDRDLIELADRLHAWKMVPAGTEGYRKAEVTAGGVDTRELDSRSLESRLVPGLHFIGEVVDVTGWLGGYNFQWAWASAAACARGLASNCGSPEAGL